MSNAPDQDARPLVQRAIEAGWKLSGCELFDHGYRVGFESADGKLFLTTKQMAEVLDEGRDPKDVTPAEPLP